jgi:SAM-dependent methyltransferase
LFTTTPQPHDLAAYRALTAWYKGSLGQHLLGREQSLVDEMLGRRFGYHLLQLGCAELDLYRHSPMGHRFAFTPFTEATEGYQAVVEIEELPLATSSVDCVLLHHALDYSIDQHQLLREVTRVLIPGGDVIIVGFNPLSSWGLRNKLFPGPRPVPWHARMLGRVRVCDWLKLLEFHIDEVRYAEYALPIDAPAAIRYSGWMESLASRFNWPSGAVYVIAARKQVLPLIPVQQRRRRVPVSPLTIPVAGPSGKTANLPLAAKEGDKCSQ